MRVGRWLLVAVVVALAGLSLAAPSLGLGRTDGVAQLIGVRGLLGCGLVALAALCAVGAVRWRERVDVRRPLAVTAALLVVVALANVAVLSSRGLGAGDPPTAASEQPAEITVITLNVLSGDADADALVDAVISTGADVLAITEAAKWFRERIERRLERAGLDFSMFTGESTGSPSRGSALYISAALGPYVGVATPYLGVVRVEAADGVGPPFAVVHPNSPPRIPFGGAAAEKTQRWRAELDVVIQLAAEMPGGVIAGDFNATVDHLALDDVAGYADVGETAGIAGYATLPSWLPGCLGAAIDHVLIDPATLALDGAAVMEIPGTDHRAVVARLATV